MNELESLLFNININSNAPSQGALLVAEPFLKEGYFNHAVICLVEYSPGAHTMGIVLNLETGINLQSVVAEITREESIPLFCGGPLSNNRLYYIHTLGELIPDSREITPGLYIGGNFNSIIDYVNSGYPIEGKIRFFIGYSGWDIGQLEDELRQNVWAVTSASRLDTLLAGKGNKYWHKLVRSMGPEYRGWLYHPQNLTDN